MNAHWAAVAAARGMGPIGMAPPPGGQGEGGGPMSFLPLLFMLMAIFYFLVFRPQQRKQKEQKEVLSSLRKGDHVVTSGGIRGIVAGIKDDVVVLKVADNVKIEFSLSAVAAVTKREGAPS
ncbi:MAG: preprotein translocase subunit YajC [bacterium]|nr:preprotein translocase subunit YajC [bacterium]